MGVELVVAGVVAAGAAAYGAYEQGEAAEDIKNTAERQRAEALKYAAPDPNELKAIYKSVDSTNALIARNNRILDSVDPALIEAGQQALNLMQGSDAKILTPIRRERDRQRQMLRARLSEQMGGGFEQSSAGQRALQEFDNQTSLMLEDAQMNALSTMLGTSQNARQMANPAIGAQASQNNANLFGNIATRKTNAAIGTGTAQYAGAEHVGGVAMANALGNMGDMVATYGMYKMKYGQPKITQTTTHAGPGQVVSSLPTPEYTPGSATMGAGEVTNTYQQGFLDPWGNQVWKAPEPWYTQK
jgi:hypothetical protein